MERYATGKTSIRELSAETGLNRQTLYRYLLGGLGDAEHYELVTMCLVNRIREADEQLEAATDKVGVAKWAHIARFSRLDLERRRPGLYGAKPITVNVAAVGVDAGLIGAASELLARIAEPARVLEHEPIEPNTVTIEGEGEGLD